MKLWDQFKDWWARPPALDDEMVDPEHRDEMIEWAAQQAKRFGVLTPAYIFAGMNRPLMFVYSQFAHFFSPIADVYMGGRAQEIGYMLEDESNLDRFLNRLEALSDEEDAQRATAREQRREAKRARGEGRPPDAAP